MSSYYKCWIILYDSHARRTTNVAYSPRYMRMKGWPLNCWVRFALLLLPFTQTPCMVHYRFLMTLRRLGHVSRMLEHAIVNWLERSPYNAEHRFYLRIRWLLCREFEQVLKSLVFNVIDCSRVIRSWRLINAENLIMNFVVTRRLSCSVSLISAYIRGVFVQRL